MSTSQTGSTNPPAISQQAPTQGSWGKKRAKVLAMAFGVVVLACGLAYLLWPPKDAPRLNAKIEEILHYVDTSGFRKLPFDRQFVYLKSLEERADDLATAYKNKRLSVEEYEEALEYAWFGKQLSHMEKYFTLRNGAERQMYLDKLLDKKVKEKKSHKASKSSDKSGSKAAPAKPITSAKPAAASTAQKLPRDHSFEKTLPLTWAPEVRSQWDQFRKALRDREKAMLKEGRKKSKDAAKQAEKAAAPKPAV